MIDDIPNIVHIEYCSHQKCLGKTRTEEQKRKMREAWVKRRQKPISDETRKKLSSIQKGVPKKSENIRNHARMLAQSNIICPHCNQSGSIPNMKRWHFDFCKNKDQNVFEILSNMSL